MVCQENFSISFSLSAFAVGVGSSFFNFESASDFFALVEKSGALILLIFIDLDFRVFILGIRAFGQSKIQCFKGGSDFLQTWKGQTGVSIFCLNELLGSDCTWERSVLLPQTNFMVDFPCTEGPPLVVFRPLLMIWNSSATLIACFRNNWNSSPRAERDD